jgi:hypothetical protein
VKELLIEGLGTAYHNPVVSEQQPTERPNTGDGPDISGIDGSSERVTDRDDFVSEMHNLRRNSLCDHVIPI